MAADLDVAGWEIAGIETEGLTPHPWLRHPQTRDLWLWKEVTPARAHRREHLVERAVSAIGSLLAVPVAEIRLGVRAGKPGCLSRNVRPHGWRLELGAHLLNALERAFDARAARPVGYTIDNVVRVLAGKRPPPTALGLPTELSAFDVLVGYLLLDALVGNGDRHARNWAVLLPPEGPAALSPAFDNASGLGFDLDDERRMLLLDSDDGVVRWAKRGRARAWTGSASAKPSLVELLEEAWPHTSQLARDTWARRCSGLEPTDVESVLRTVPGLTEPTVAFAARAVEINRERALSVCLP